MEDDFCGTALDPDKWVSDVPAPLTFTPGGVACAGAVALRFRDRLEIGGLNILEQTGISYASGQGIVGGLFSGGFAVNYCIAGVMLTNGNYLSGHQWSDECFGGPALAESAIRISDPHLSSGANPRRTGVFKQRLQRSECPHLAGVGGHHACGADHARRLIRRILRR